MSGTTVLIDTNVFVSARNRDEAGYPACRRLLDAVDGGRYRALVSAITIAEMRAGFTSSEGATVWKVVLSHLETSPHYSVEPVDSAIAESAGELRPDSRISLPDALIVATGRLRGASCVVTQDKELARRQSILSVKSPRDLE